MSIKTQAKAVQRVGHSNSLEDSVLAHISRGEASMLKRMGGSGRIDPITGLPHFEEGGGGTTDGAGGGPGNAGDYGGFGGDYSGEFGGDYGDGLGPDYSGMNADAAIGPSDFGDVSPDAYGAYSPDFSVDVVGQRGYDTADSGYSNAGVNGGYAPSNQEQNYAKTKSALNSRTAQTITTLLSILNPGFAAMNTIGRTALAGWGAYNGDYGPAGGRVGGTIGGAIGGPLGGMAGATIGNSIGNSMSGSAAANGLGGQSMGSNSGSGMAGGDNLLNGLAALYMGNQNSKNINGQIGGLQSLYGQDSPYSQQLRQQLERRDAASGRRSQYGPREVELQAALAGLNSRNAPQLSALYNQKMLNRQRMIQAGMFGIQQAGGIRGIGNGLRDLFGGSSPGMDFSQFNQTPMLPSDQFNLNEFGPGLSNFEAPSFDFGP